MQRFILLGMGCILACGMPGCSDKGDRPEIGYVSGNVTLDGQPLVGAAVNFQPDSGRAASGMTDKTGDYVLEHAYKVNGAKVGPNKVYFDYPTGFPATVPIPSQYSGQLSSLKEDVQAGTNKFDFHLESSGSGDKPAAKKAVAPVD